MGGWAGISGDTALLLAIRRGSFPLTKLLVDAYGADVNAGNFAKETPLLAVRCGFSVHGWRGRRRRHCLR